MTKISNDKDIEAREPHWIEWVSGVVSALVVVAIVAWIGKDAVVDRDTTPDLKGIVLRTEKRSNGVQVLFEISNESSATASQVAVRGEITDGEAVLERVEMVLDYVPGHSKAKGGLIFREDPTGKTVTVRADAFAEP